MAYSKDSVFIDKELRVLIGSACYVEIASTLKEWRFSKLESLIDNKNDDERTNYYRRLAYGLRMEDKTIERIGLISPLDSRRQYIKKWRDHSFWKVLKVELGHDEIEQALLTVTGSAQERIWFDKNYSGKRPARFDDIDNGLIDGIARTKSFNSLIALVTLAREAYLSNHPRTFFNSAQKAVEIFPTVIIQTPHLYIRWSRLYDRLSQLIWQKTSDFATFDNLYIPNQRMQEEIDKLDVLERAKPQCKLPPRKIIERFNKTI